MGVRKILKNSAIGAAGFLFSVVIAVFPVSTFASTYGSGTYGGGAYAGSLAHVTTSAAAAISTKGATLNGSIDSIGSSTPTVRGFGYGSSSAYGATTTESGSFSTGAFSGSISSLTCNTSYHFRAYATNSQGTGYGSDATFTTSACSTSSGSGPSGGNRTNGSSVPTSISQPTNSGGLSTTQKQSILGLLQAFGADAAVIGNVTAALNGQPVTIAGSATGSPTPATVFPLTRDLYVGMSGDDVRFVQQFLKDKGYYSYPTITGYFGAVTKAAVQAFQKDNGIPTLGGVGPLTRAKILQMQ